MYNMKKYDNMYLNVSLTEYMKNILGDFEINGTLFSLHIFNMIQQCFDISSYKNGERGGELQRTDNERTEAAW